MTEISRKPPPTWRRRIVRLAIGLALTYLGVVVVFLLLENWLLFHPAGPNEWMAPPNPTIKDVELTAADGTKIHGWWFPRHDTQLALLYFHGNSGNLSFDGEAMLQLGERLGVSVLIIDYPGYGKSGGKPSEAGCYAAADAAYAWLTSDRAISGDKILIFGDSLGGGVAVDLASRQPHRALILTKTFTSMADVGQRLYPWLPVRWLITNRFESLVKLDKCRQPIFIAHGTADDLVPFSHGEKLFQAAHEPKQFLRIDAATHNDALPVKFFVELKAFLARTAPQPGPAAK
jgi:fermentation-respiration switch protein FrsA (DUF1100 family)